MAALAGAPSGSPGEERTIPALDGFELAAREFVPGGEVRGAVLIAPAMGVGQPFYGALGDWLAGRGFRALTFDFRGSGRSRRGPLGAVDADVLDWAERDAGAALAWLRERAGALPITWIGHSLGGQIVPFVPGHEGVRKIVTVAAGSGYWRQNAAPLRRKVWLFWFGFVPLLTPLFGYFPGRRLGMVGDLPRGVALQWRRWCLDPEYAVGVEPGARERYAAVTAPVTSLSFTDDEMMSQANVESLHGFYRGSRVALRRFSPAEVGLDRIGHFGFFRSSSRAPLWDRVLLAELATRDGDMSS